MPYPDSDFGDIQKLNLYHHMDITVSEYIYNWNNKHLDNPTKTIAFIGDSYCATIEHWPAMVAKHFNAEILQIGFAGLSFVSSFFHARTRRATWDASKWHTRRATASDKSVLERADIIIVCVSAYDRLPTRTTFPISSAAIDTSLNSGRLQSGSLLSKRVKNRIVNAGKIYYDHLFFSSFHYIAQKGAIRELDDFVKTDQTIIWLPCFFDSMCDYKPKNGVMGNLELKCVADKDDGLKLGNEFAEIPANSNHMSVESQQQLAKYLIDYITHKTRQHIPITELIK